MTSRSIPTWHAGVLFRSRTEAKWAFWMDRLDVKWTYETEGRDTDGEWYLPDFVIFAALGMLWAEIKPAYAADPDGIGKWRRFAAQRPQPSRAALIVGEPGRYSTIVIGGDQDADRPVRGPWEEDSYLWRPCPGGHHFDLAWPGRFGSELAEDGCEPSANNAGERMDDAAVAARSHHFRRPGAAA